MPKATITTPAGTKVTIEGSTEEVHELVLRLEPKSVRHPSKSTIVETGRPTTQKAIKDYILELREAGLFGETSRLGRHQECAAGGGTHRPYHHTFWCNAWSRQVAGIASLPGGARLEVCRAIIEAKSRRLADEGEG